MTNDDLSVIEKCDEYFKRVNLRGRAMFLPCDPVPSQNWMNANVAVKKSRPYLLSTVVVPSARHVNKYKPTNWNEVFPDLVDPEFDYADIVQAIKEDDLVAASDGSVLKEKGSAAFCFSVKDGTILFQYSTRVHGDVGDVHSTRTEMAAMLGIIVLLRELCKHHKFDEKPTIEIFSDSAKAIKAATENIFISIKKNLKTMLTLKLN